MKIRGIQENVRDILTTGNTGRPGYIDNEFFNWDSFFIMPRKARIDAPGAVQHIIRGIEQKDIFRDNIAKDTFIDRYKSFLCEKATPC